VIRTATCDASRCEVNFALGVHKVNQKRARK
jgi:hypothetical protein